MSSNPSSQFEWSRISLGNRVAGISAIVLLIATFLPWITVDFGPVSDSASGFGQFKLGKLAALCAVLIIAVIVIELFAPQVTLPVAPSLIVLGLGVLAVICVGWHVLFLPDGASELNDALDDAVGDAAGGVDLGGGVGRGWGVFVAFVAAVGTAVGGYLKLSE
jgi:hypothetical protein